MSRAIRELVQERSAEIVGRTAERAVLLRTLEEGGPFVVFVHGLAGVGKSTLLDAFAREARGLRRDGCADRLPVDRADRAWFPRCPRRRCRRSADHRRRGGGATGAARCARRARPRHVRGSASARQLAAPGFRAGLARQHALGHRRSRTSGRELVRGAGLGPARTGRPAREPERGRGPGAARPSRARRRRRTTRQPGGTWAPAVARAGSRRRTRPPRRRARGRGAAGGAGPADRPLSRRSRSNNPERARHSLGRPPSHAAAARSDAARPRAAGCVRAPTSAFLRAARAGRTRRP